MGVSVPAALVLPYLQTAVQVFICLTTKGWGMYLFEYPKHSLGGDRYHLVYGAGCSAPAIDGIFAFVARSVLWARSIDAKRGFPAVYAQVVKCIQSLTMGNMDCERESGNSPMQAARLAHTTTPQSKIRARALIASHHLTSAVVQTLRPYVGQDRPFYVIPAGAPAPLTFL